MKRILTVTEAARNFADVVNRAYYRNESTLLMRSGEAVARIEPVIPDARLGRDLARIWREMPALGPEEAEAFEADLKDSQERLPLLSDQWD